MNQVLITAGRILLGPSSTHIDDGAVLVSGATIVAAGARNDVLAHTEPGCRVMDFPGATVLPGLIDCHVHLAFDAGPDPVTTLTDSDDATLLLGMAGRAQQLLDAGITTARDLGDRGGLSVRLRDAISDGAMAGPRILAATAPLTPPKGHCWFLGGEVEGENEIRQKVRRNAEEGADVIKVMATGGGLTRGGPSIWQLQFTTEELAVVVEEAHRLGLPVAAHAHGVQGIAASITAGVDTIEHCSWMTEDGTPELREDLIAQLIAKQIHVCPANHPNWQAFADRVGPEKAAALFAPTRRMAESGVQLVAGTDAGIPRAYFGGLISSLEFFEHLGVPRHRIIDMATTSAASALRLGDQTGRLATGYRADILIVDGDPLTGLDALRAVRLVLAGGRFHVPHSAVAAWAQRPASAKEADCCA
ncbi:amidohydrolase family protein [Streptomyces griseofuscus]|uniref:metal-dependent hydrolase family protein n=1 Tax=Streptomyces TaxID=1883 RepID=UPI00081F377B|nr:MULTISPECIES: amidohydrolase family protein [unclassified Streptomyces]SCF97365.1 Imidazolonepropionase [Streptomyces sp. LamerLS-31b]SCG01964.1 Imidazolonepropionase [Streptomyces sp. DconLS]